MCINTGKNHTPERLPDHLCQVLRKDFTPNSPSIRIHHWDGFTVDQVVLINSVRICIQMT